jgi:hypothetical protein
LWRPLYWSNGGGSTSGFQVPPGGEEPLVFRGPGILGFIWIIVGVVVAASYDYFENLDTLRRVLSAVLAIVLWPLLLLGVDLHIKK